MQELMITRNRVVAPEFRWRDNTGQMHRPEDMETRHLFNVVSMIWNHAMPEDARTHNYKRYVFSPEYTGEYFQLAIRVMIPILLNRRDLAPYMKARLEFMMNYFNRAIFELAPPYPSVTGDGLLYIAAN